MSENESDKEPDRQQPGQESPPPGSAETTDPLPAVQDEPQPTPLQAAIDQPTAALPLLDLLAPRQPGSPAGTPPGQAPGSGSPLGFVPQAGPDYPVGGPVAGGQVPGGLISGGGLGPTMVGRAAAPPPNRPGPRGWPLVAGIAGCVVLLGLIGWVAIGSLPSGEQPTTTTQAAPPTSSIMVADGYQFTQQSARADTDCASNAYGQVAEFFRDRPCSGLRRLLFTSSVDGRPVVVSVATVTMPDEQGAAALRQLADTNGTGNVSDLLRAGVRIPSVPESMSNASYASAQSGATVVIVESDYTDPAQRTDDVLERISEAAIQLGRGGG